MTLWRSDEDVQPPPASPPRMPGIAGVISSKSAGECERMVTAMIATMKHEPFYESGACSAPAMGVYAGWTAHPRSFAARESAAGQPPNRDLMWVWSGECAGETVGVDIATSYIRLGDGVVRELNGLLSDLLIDRDRA